MEVGLKTVTSAACRREAEANLMRKRPDRADVSERILRSVGSVSKPIAHVLAAARAADADLLITGDVTHFGSLMDRDDLPLRVVTPRDFLLRG